jgi:G3E family GTPase
MLVCFCSCLQTFFVDDDLKESCQLDAVLCLVDAKHITQHLDEVKPEGVVNEAGAALPSSAASFTGF